MDMSEVSGTVEPTTTTTEVTMSEQYEQRHDRNEQSRNAADYHRQPWTEYEDQLLQDLWTATHTEEELAEIAEALGRTIEACRQRYFVVRRAETVTYESSSSVGRKGQQRTETSRVEKTRPAWMDEEGLPDWYV
jgi:hypothetical protein